MPNPSEFEIGKIAEIVAGKVGAKLDAKALRHVIDSVVDGLKRGNEEIEGVTCDTTQAPSIDTRETAEPKPVRSTGKALLQPEEELGSDEGGLYEQIEKTDATRVIIAAFGKNRPGVVAAITDVLAELSCSIEDISQTIMQEFFSMIMIVDIAGCTLDFAGLRDKIKETERSLGMKVYVMHEDIFRFMHRI